MSESTTETSPKKRADLSVVKKRDSFVLTEIERTLRRYPTGDFEIRVLKFDGKAIPKLFSADEIPKAVQYAASWSGKAKGVYFTLNPVEPKTKGAAGDDHILRLTTLGIDCDAVRNSGISSTDAEHDAALKRAGEVRLYLMDEFEFPALDLCDSGNGYHVNGRIDLPNDEPSRKLVAGFLATLARRFPDDGVKIDTSVANPSRIWKTYGTMVCKGPDTPDRPHRLAKILKAPETMELVTREMMEAVIRANPPPPPKPIPDYSNKTNPISWTDIKPLVEGSFTKEPKLLANGADLYELDLCPFGSDHEKNTAGFLMVFPTSGNVVPGCHHERCQKKTFIDIIKHVAPELLDKLRKNGLPYLIRNGGLCRVQWKKDDDGNWVPEYTQLTNFITNIKATIIHDDGVIKTYSYDLETVFDGVTAHQTVTGDDFDAIHWIHNIASNAVIYPGPGKREHTNVGIRLLSGKAPESYVYIYTGWRKEEDGEWVYLHGGGGIDRHGERTGIKTALPEGLGRMKLSLAANDQDRTQAIQASLDLLKVGQERIMIPLLAGVYRVPIDMCDFSLDLVGETGAFKTEIAARAQQHFGREFNRLSLPGNWSGTANAIEMMLFSAKDMVAVIDDYAPASLPMAEQMRLKATAARLFRAQGDRSGRMRLSQKIEQRAVKPPRGMIISTGEDVAGGQSLNARKLILEFRKGDIDKAALKGAQLAGEGGLYECAMGEYVKWLAGCLDEMRKERKARESEYRDRANLKDTHARTPGVVADLAFGWETFIKFAHEAGVITEKEAGKLVERGWDVLSEAGHFQKRHQDELDPVNQFIAALTSASSAGIGHLADGKTARVPDKDNAESYGWKIAERWTGEEKHLVPEPRGELFGWVDGPDLYLNPEASYKIAQRVSPNNSFTISPIMLHKLLHERGLLTRTDIKAKGRETYTSRATIRGKRIPVLWMSVGLLGFDEVEPANRPPSFEDDPTNPKSDHL